MSFFSTIFSPITKPISVIGDTFKASKKSSGVVTKPSTFIKPSDPNKPIVVKDKYGNVMKPKDSEGKVSEWVPDYDFTKNMGDKMSEGRKRAYSLYGMKAGEIGQETQGIISQYKDRLNNMSQSKNRANTLKRQARAATGRNLTAGESAQLDRSAAFDVSSEQRQNLGDYRGLLGNIAANTGSLEMGFGNLGVAGTQTPMPQPAQGLLGGACCWIFLEARYGNGKMDSIVRRFRDEHMTERNRRGYYKLSSVLVPLMRKYKLVKFLVQSLMTTPMFYYGKYFYGENKWGIIFTPIAKFWLGLYDFLGGEHQFIRENGEIV